MSEGSSDSPRKVHRLSIVQSHQLYQWLLTNQKRFRQGRCDGRHDQSQVRRERHAEPVRGWGMMGPGFFDGKCPECGDHVGWYGRMVDRPACPGCGHRVSMVQLEASQAKLDAADDKVTEQSRAVGQQIRKARLLNSMISRHAARLAGISTAKYHNIEAGRHDGVSKEEIERVWAVTVLRKPTGGGGC